jgi:hypothetical protein
MEKKRTSSGPFRESTRKHSIYTRPQPPVLSVRCEPAACRRHPALASRWRGACGPTPGAGISGQGGMGWADAVGGKGRLIFLSPCAYCTAS